MLVVLALAVLEWARVIVAGYQGYTTMLSIELMLAPCAEASTALSRVAPQ